MNKLRVGIDNYSLFPKKYLPHEMVRWASENGAEGVAFSGYSDDSRKNFTSSYLQEVRQISDDLGLYLEWGNGQHVPMDLSTFGKKEICQSNRKAVEEASALGVKIIRSCSGGLMRWVKDSPSTMVILKEAASELKKQASMFRDNGMILAIETHFEFTTFELLRLFEMCEVDPGDYLGICLDTMNLLTMLEEPVAATDRVLPWIVSTHIKDGGILHNENGITTFPSEIGNGVIDLKEIIEKIASLNRDISLSVEDHGGQFHLPVNETWFIERFPDLTEIEYKKLLKMSNVTLEKIRSGKLGITDRESWATVCEERNRADLRSLRIIRDSLKSD